MSVFSNPAASAADQGRAYTRAIIDLLGSRDPTHVLATTASHLQDVVDRLTVAQLAKPEAPGKWSVAQVLQHLGDVELVLGWRIRMVLAHDRPSLAGYDQDLWAERLAYVRVDARDALRDFSAIRDANLRLIARVPPDDLDRIGVHAERGEESVRHMMRLYAGHDLAHLEQIARIMRGMEREQQ